MGKLTDNTSAARRINNNEPVHDRTDKNTEINSYMHFRRIETREQLILSQPVIGYLAQSTIKIRIEVVSRGESVGD